MVRTWVDWLLDFPWVDPPEETLDIERAAAILDEDHYGLTKVKDRILEWLAVRDRIRVKDRVGERGSCRRGDPSQSCGGVSWVVRFWCGHRRRPPSGLRCPPRRHPLPSRLGTPNPARSLWRNGARYRRRSCVSLAPQASARLRSDGRLHAHSIGSSCACRWAAFVMRRRFADIGAPTSVHCPAGSSSQCAPREHATR